MKMKKSLPHTVSLLLTAVLTLGLMGTALAFTTNTGTSASVQADLPMGVFLNANLGDVSLTEGGYYYDRGLGCYVQEYYLSDASKLSLLLDYCMPVYRLSDELSRLRENNRLAGLGRYLDNNQQVTIWDCLTSATQNKINRDRMTAEQALSYIKTSTEYQSNSTLQKYVNYYLDELLNGREVREILKTMSPSSATRYESCNVTQLLNYGETLMLGRSYENLYNAMTDFCNESTTPRALEQNYSARQLARYYSTLSDAAEAYYSDYIRTLDGMRFTVSR